MDVESAIDVLEIVFTVSPSLLLLQIKFPEKDIAFGESLLIWDIY